MADDEIDNSNEPSDVESPLDGPPTEALQIVEATPVEPMEPVDVQPAVIEPTTVMGAMPADVTPSPTPTGLTPERKRLAIIGGAVAAVLLIVIIIVASGGDDDQSVTPGSSTTEFGATTTSTSAEATTTSSAGPDSTVPTDSNAPTPGSVPDGSPAASGPYPPQLSLLGMGATISPDGRTMLVSPAPTAFCCGGVVPVRLVDLATGQVIRTFGDFDNAVAFSPDGSKVLTSRANSEVTTVWPIGGGAGVTFPTGSITRFSPDGTTLLEVKVETGGATVRQWDTATGAQLSSVIVPPGQVEVSPDGTQLLDLQSGMPLALWDVATGVQIRLVSEATDIFRVSFSPDGSSLAVIRANGTATVYDTATATVRSTMTALSAADGGLLVFTPDSGKLLIRAAKDTLSLRDVATGDEVTSFTLPAEFLLGADAGFTADASFSSDGSKLAAGFNTGGNPDQGVVVWDVATGAKIIHVLGLNWSTFSPDGARLLGREGGGYLFVYAV